ncbi:MAG: hypothetical protein QXL94_03930 [Candidatus Parvarchaeum sp.]
MKINSNIFGGQTYEGLAKELDKRMNENSSIVSDAIRGLANDLSQGTHNLMQEIAISDEDRLPDTKPMPQKPKMLPMPLMPSYTPQASNEPMVPVLAQLKRLRA